MQRNFREQLDMYLHQILLAEENKFDQKTGSIKTIQSLRKDYCFYISV